MKGLARMSITKQWFTQQGQTTPVKEALDKVRYVSRALHGIESSRELDMEALHDLCVRLNDAEKILTELEQEEVYAD
jgi:hypothetical protein